MDDIVKLHINHKYIINISKIERGCFVSFPSNYIVNPPIFSKTIKYTLHDNELKYIIDDKIEQTFKIEKYVARFAILTDILYKALQLKIPNNLIIVYDNNQIKSSLISILPEPSSQEDKNKEKLISHHYPDIMIGLFDYASANKLDITRGFQNLCHIIESGGLI